MLPIQSVVATLRKSLLRNFHTSIPWCQLILYRKYREIHDEHKEEMKEMKRKLEEGDVDMAYILLHVNQLAQNNQRISETLAMY